MLHIRFNSRFAIFSFCNHFNIQSCFQQHFKAHAHYCVVIN